MLSVQVDELCGRVTGHAGELGKFILENVSLEIELSYRKKGETFLIICCVNMC